MARFSPRQAQSAEGSLPTWGQGLRGATPHLGVAPSQRGAGPSLMNSSLIGDRSLPPPLCSPSLLGHPWGLCPQADRGGEKEREKSEMAHRPASGPTWWRRGRSVSVPSIPTSPLRPELPPAPSKSFFPEPLPSAVGPQAQSWLGASRRD